MKHVVAHFNIGSYGAPPRAVVQYMRDLSDRIESMPDIYIRKDWLPMLNEVRSGVAKLINADFEEVVMVPNTTVGINTVVRNIDWKEGDVILMCEPSRDHHARVAHPKSQTRLRTEQSVRR